MTDKFWFNGIADGAIPNDNRLLRFGDGIFETMRLEDGRLPLLDYHRRRLRTSCSRLRLDYPDGLDKWLLELTDLSGVLRLAVFSSSNEQKGYARESTDSQFMAWFKPRRLGAIHEELRLKSVVKSYDSALSGLKSASALSYVLSSITGPDLACYLSSDGHVIETQRGNLIFQKGDTLVTPDLSSAGVAGVMLSALSEYAQSQGREITVQPIEMTSVGDYDSVWEVNALRGVSRVVQIDDCTFECSGDELLQWGVEVFKR
jgi:4-amino-4-deoxychorismate lyase